MTVLEARRRILHLQAKIDLIEYPTGVLAAAREKLTSCRSKQKTARRFFLINQSCLIVQRKINSLQSKINFYLTILKQNPYIVSERDKAASRALDLMLRKSKRPKMYEDEIIRLEMDYNDANQDYDNFLHEIAKYQFESLSNDKKVFKNNSYNPRQNIKGKIVDIRENIKVIDVDTIRRSYIEWAHIYHLQLVNYNSYEAITEYEFCWALENFLQYNLLNDDVAEKKELRAKLIYTDMIQNASELEKVKLKDNFILTDFIKKHLYNLY